MTGQLLPLVAVDVAYRGSLSAAAAVWAFDWQDPKPAGAVTCCAATAAPYRPGQFYLRELPPILQVLGKLPGEPGIILVDGYVFLDAAGTPGLGGHLYRVLPSPKPVIGVAKSFFPGAKALPVWRGNSHKPLWVSAVGVESGWAAQKVAAMAGAFRLPALLRQADQRAREALTCSAGTVPPLGTRRG